MNANNSSLPGLALAPLVGHEVGLRPVNQADYEFIRTVELSQHLGPRWRHQGATPAPEVFAQSLWRGVLAQFLVIEPRGALPLGLVCVYNADLSHEFAYLAVVNFDPNRRTTKVGQGLLLFLNYVFSTWEFQKLYVETPGYSLGQYARIAREFLVEEGCLRNHFRRGGRSWDLHIFALYRTKWLEQAGRVMPTILSQC